MIFVCDQFDNGKGFGDSLFICLLLPWLSFRLRSGSVFHFVGCDVQMFMRWKLEIFLSWQFQIEVLLGFLLAYLQNDISRSWVEISCIYRNGNSYRSRIRFVNSEEKLGMLWDDLTVHVLFHFTCKRGWIKDPIISNTALKKLTVLK